MLRRMMKREIDAVQAGQDPAGVCHDPARALHQFQAGNYFVD
jgi:hypothetical protein